MWQCLQQHYNVLVSVSSLFFLFQFLTVNSVQILELHYTIDLYTIRYTLLVFSIFFENTTYCRLSVCTVGNTTVFHGRYSLFYTVGAIRWLSPDIFSSCVTLMLQMTSSSWSPVPTYIPCKTATDQCFCAVIVTFY